MGTVDGQRDCLALRGLQLGDALTLLVLITPRTSLTFPRIAAVIFTDRRHPLVAPTLPAAAVDRQAQMEEAIGVRGVRLAME